MTLVLGVDPGHVSGLALVRTDPLAIEWALELQPLETCKRAAAVMARYGPNLHVVAERFVITPRTTTNTQQPWSLYLIGALWYLAETHKVASFELQSAADAKSFVSNSRLQSLELWSRGGKGHANDALRHVVVRLVRLGWHDPRLLGK